MISAPYSPPVLTQTQVHHVASRLVGPVHGIHDDIAAIALLVTCGFFTIGALERPVRVELDIRSDTGDLVLRIESRSDETRGECTVAVAYILRVRVLVDVVVAAHDLAVRAEAAAEWCALVIDTSVYDGHLDTSAPLPTTIGLIGLDYGKLGQGTRRIALTLVQRTADETGYRVVAATRLEAGDGTAGLQLCGGPDFLP